MSDNLKELLSKKNLINILILAILVLAVPVGVELIKSQQILRSRADTGNEIKFVVNTGVLECTGNACTTNRPDVLVEIQAPADSEFKQP